MSLPDHGTHSHSFGSAYPHLGGFESTYIFGSGLDILATTRHLEFWEADLNLLYESGIHSLRYSIPWHRIEQSPNEFDWTWIDGPLQWMQDKGLSPIVDPLHHTSFPDWLVGGFLHPEFPSLYARFLDRISDRYPWLTRYTVINEPLPTTLFCSYTGMWYPYCSSDRDFVSMSLAVAKAIVLGSDLLKRKNSETELVDVGTAEHHRALDGKVSDWVDYANERRFLMLDLILGRVQRDNPSYQYLLAHGASHHSVSWFEDHPTTVDVLGLDYYLHSEMEWFWNKEKGAPDIAPFNQRPRGFAAVAQDYKTRFARPLLLTETNIRGTIGERLRWLKFMEEQCEALVSAGTDFRGFCWYPSIDSTDWANACTRCTRIVDPQGIWTLDESCTSRHPSELSEIYSKLAQGQITAKDIPMFPIGSELRKRLHCYFPLMLHS